ncbi:MAG TPA: hypothetical protein VGW38_06705, partial [Chloroflexota bacterium]|nr:hypothetical protein [Chloroflexota bacterium]
FVPEEGRLILRNWIDRAILSYFIAFHAYVTFGAITLEEGWSTVYGLVMLSALLRATRFGSKLIKMAWK